MISGAVAYEPNEDIAAMLRNWPDEFAPERVENQGEPHLGGETRAVSLNQFDYQTQIFIAMCSFHVKALSTIHRIYHSNQCNFLTI